MNHLLRQLRRWRLRERLVRLAWGGSRLVAAVALVLGVACFADWVYDRSADVPLALRLAMTGSQVLLAGGLAYLFLARPWVRTPPVDELAYHAEQAIPVFGHRLVTALQLNRPGAKTEGMSRALIAEVTREAGELSARHRLTTLIDYRPVGWAALLLVPVGVVWGGFLAVRPELATALLKRQALLDVPIPRSVQLENVTPEVWPAGAEVVLRYRVTGKWRETMTGTARVTPDDQPADDYALTFEKEAEDGSATFTAALPPASVPFTFSARLADGRTRAPGRVEFEPPPQVNQLDAWQLLPPYLGGRSAEVDGKPVTIAYERFQPRGEVVGALPLSRVRVEAGFNKPVATATLVVVERGDGNDEVDRERLPPAELAADRRSAEWTFAATPRTIGYRIELSDARGFVGPAPARRGVQMLPDKPPEVAFQRETNRNPDPTAFDGQGPPELYEWEFPVAWRPTGIPGEGETGPVQVIYTAKSELGIGRVNLAYRVIPRGEQGENVHPRDDPHGRVYIRLPLARVAADTSKLGRFVPDLGLFEKSFAGLGRADRGKVQVEFYPFPSPNPAAEPGELEAGGRYNFQTAGLRKPLSDGTDARLGVGDTIEIYVEVLDKYATYLEGRKLADGAAVPVRPAGYTREARRKTIVTEDEAYALIRQRDEKNKKLQDKIRDLAEDQRNIFQPGK
jgi:hypothetical protein